MKIPKSSWSLETLAARVGEVLGSRIVLQEVPGTAVDGLCGARVSFKDDHVLFIPAAKGQSVSKELVGCHELAHVICGHGALSSRNAAAVVEQIREVFPWVTPEMLHIDVDDRAAERNEKEAEFLATLLAQNAGPNAAVGALLEQYSRYRNRLTSSMFGGKGTEDALINS